MGLGPNGEPLRNVALNLPSLQNQNNLGVGSNNSAPVPVAPPPSFSSAANVLSQTQNPINNLAALNNVVGNLNNLNPLLSTLTGLGSLASNTNDTANAPAIDINKIVGAGSSSANSGLNSVVGGNAGGNFSGLSGIGSGMGSGLGSSLNQTSRLDNSAMSNPYNSNTFNSLTSNLGGGLNSNANSGFVSNQRDYNDMAGSVRNYNSQSDDFGRMQSQNFGSSQLGNGGGSNNSNVGGNVRQQNISDTILIRNVSYIHSSTFNNHNLFATNLLIDQKIYFFFKLQLPPNCTWQTLRDEFRSCGEVKFAEIRGQDCGVVRFAKERDAELAISKCFFLFFRDDFLLKFINFFVFFSIQFLFTELKDGSRFDGRKVDVSFF